MIVRFTKDRIAHALSHYNIRAHRIGPRRCLYDDDDARTARTPPCCTYDAPLTKEEGGGGRGKVGWGDGVEGGGEGAVEKDVFTLS